VPLKWDITFYKRFHQQSSVPYNRVYMYSYPLSIFVSLFSLSFTPNTHTHSRFPLTLFTFRLNNCDLAGKELWIQMLLLWLSPLSLSLSLSIAVDCFNWSGRHRYSLNRRNAPGSSHSWQQSSISAPNKRKLRAVFQVFIANSASGSC